MSTIDRLQYDAAIEERDKALRECERLTRQLEECRLDINALQDQLSWARSWFHKYCAAVRENADAQSAIKTYLDAVGELSAERDRYKRELEEAHLECRKLRNQRRKARADNDQ